MFSRRLGSLSPDARLLLAIAAAEPTAPHAVVRGAANQLAVDADEVAPELSGLAELGPTVTFRHPLVRSVAYHAMPVARRRQVHRALAESIDAGAEPDRAAWHLAMAATGPDEALAARLVEVAGRAIERGGYAANATFLSRAAELTIDAGTRARRLLAAAEAQLAAGAPGRAATLLEEARRNDPAQLEGAEAQRLAAELTYRTGHLATQPYLVAARTMMPIDPVRGRQALLSALEFATYGGRQAFETALADAAALLSAAPLPSPPVGLADRLLAGILQRFAGAQGEAAQFLRQALSDLRDGTLDDQDRMRWIPIGSIVATDLLDLDAKVAVSNEYVRLARSTSALGALPIALVGFGDACVREGRFVAAAAAHAEARQLAAATGTAFGPFEHDPALPELGVLSWSGSEGEARIAATNVIATMRASGTKGSASHLGSWLAVLELGLGNYREALGHARHAFDEDLLGWGTTCLPDLVEAAARCGERALAEVALGRLATRAHASGTAWGLGLATRSRALLAATGNAERHYHEAIDALTATSALPDLGRAHLLYGEWLRRERRRRDARAELRQAYEIFGDIGADAFAERARVELNATGEHARQRRPDTGHLLTPQEAQIAGMVAEGLTNRDVAAQIFLSPATVDYHLRKVYQKLGITSRTQLARMMLTAS